MWKIREKIKKEKEREGESVLERERDPEVITFLVPNLSPALSLILVT